jgi:hypothetical protein
VGASVEYPELEVIPGLGSLDYQGLFDSRSEMDGAADTHVRHRRETERQSPDVDRRGLPALDTAPWTQLYQDCVGSLSALRSDTELRSVGGEDDTGESHHDHDVFRTLKSTDLRNSTVDFEVQLGKEHEAVREGLIKKLEKMG